MAFFHQKLQLLSSGPFLSLQFFVQLPESVLILYLQMYGYLLAPRSPDSYYLGMHYYHLLLSFNSTLLLLLLSHFSRVRLCATHRWQPTRHPRPWDSPGKNTGVGCHFLLQSMKVKSLSRVRLLATPWTAAYQAPPSMGFSRQEY